MKTAAVMTRDVVVVSPTVSVGSAARMMERLSVRHLPVVEAGRLVGILSDRDLLEHRSAGRADTTCGEAMTPAPVTCSSDTSIGRVAELMLEHKIDSVPVVGPSGTLTGLVTSTDLLSLLVERDEVQALPFDFRLRIARSDGDALAFAAWSQIEEIPIASGSPLRETEIAKTGLRTDVGLILVAIKRKAGHMEFNPGDQVRIAEGDTLIVMGRRGQLDRAEKLAAG
jgi:CBS domain-containing protein